MNLKSNEVLILRTCRADMTAYGGFKWPKRGKIEAPDWNPDPTINCGQGLHGMLWGEGIGNLFLWAANAKWLVVKAKVEDVVSSSGGGKVRFRRGSVVHCGNQKSATEYIIANGANGAVIGAVVTAGNYGTATAGDRGTATTGYEGTATAGDEGTATAGDRGTATTGYEGTATAGDGGTATTGDRGTATAGDGGIIQIRYWGENRYCIKTGYIGENNLKPNTAYRLNSQHQFEEFCSVKEASDDED